MSTAHRTCARDAERLFTPFGEIMAVSFAAEDRSFIKTTVGVDRACVSFARHTAVAAQREEQSRFEGVFFPDVSSLHQGSSKVVYRCRCKSALKCVVSVGTLISVPHVIIF